MASHTPQESQSPERQDPRPSEQPTTQDFAPAKPDIPSFPGWLEQDTALIPAAVFGVAQAAGLGSPIRAYTRKQPPRQPLIIALFENADFWLSMIGLCVLGIMLTILSDVSFPLGLIIVGMLLLAFQPLVLLMVQARVAAHLRRRNVFRAWSCAGGLVYTQDEQYHALRWEQIEVVIRKIIPLNNVYATAGFLVLQSGAPPFEFALLQGPYAEYLQSLGKMRYFTIVASNGKQSIRVFQADGLMEVSGTIDLSAYAGLGELIEEQMISQHWPRVLAAYLSGAGVAFGPLVVNQQGLTAGDEVLGWDELAEVKIAEGNLYIIEKPDNDNWDVLPILTIPNLALLLTLLHRVREL